MPITDPAVAAAHVTLEIAEGDRFTTAIIIREADFSGEASARQALIDALTVHDARWPAGSRPARVEVAARWDIHGVEVDVDQMELPDAGFVTVVINLVSTFTLEMPYHASVLDDIRRAIEAHEDESGTYMNRLVYLVTQEQR